MSKAFEGVAPLARLRWRFGVPAEDGVRLGAEEVPVALVHDGSTTAVMMATPADLEDFGMGFSLTEGLIDGASDIRDVELVEGDLGVEVRMWLAPSCSTRLSSRRRRLAGPTGCGLCGVESLAEAVRPPARVKGRLRVSPEDIVTAMSALGAAQTLGAATRAVHAAGLWTREGIKLVREDVGRHNALDKLVGASMQMGGRPADVLLLTSRVSVEMVQKAAALGVQVLCAISAPTALAARMADQAGMTLVGVVRDDGIEVFTHRERIETG